MSVSIWALSYFVHLFSRCVLRELLLHFMPFLVTKGFVRMLCFWIAGETCNKGSMHEENITVLKTISQAISHRGDQLGQWTNLKVASKPLFTYCVIANKTQKQVPVPKGFIFPHGMALDESQMDAVQMGESSHYQGALNKRLLPLYVPMGQEEGEKEGLGVERHWVKVEKSALTQTPD